MANIPIWPGSSSFDPGGTPFGFYDYDAEFRADADKVSVFCARRLGYPLVDVELQSGSFYTAFEEAVTTYGNELYAYKIRDNQLFRHDKSLNDYSPKFLEIYKNMQRFIKDKKPTGKILFYSDFRSDAGSEAFELMLQCNGYSKLNTENLPESKDFRYTFT